MKKKINEEIKRMQTIAGIIKEEYQEESAAGEFYVIDAEGYEPPEGPFSKEEADAKAEELEQQGGEWNVVPADTAKQIYSHLGEDAMEEYQSKSTESFTIGDLEYMDNDELIAVLQRIKEVYSNPELDNMDSAGVANHIGMAIELIKKRISN